jgi:hypothetical protein
VSVGRDAVSKFDLSFECWPLAVATFGDAFADADYDAMFAQFDVAFARRERFVTLNDVRAQKSMPSAKHRARVAEWTRSVEPLIRQYSLGYALVVLSPIARGALTAIDWLNPPKCPQAYFAAMPAACDWCIERLRSRNLPLEPRISAYRESLAGAPVGGAGLRQ